MIFNLKNINLLLKLKHIYSFIAFLFLFSNLHSQDIHFSQFYNSSIITNSANTGVSGKKIRFANVYRNQWSKIGVPYKTFCSSLDKKISIPGQNISIGGFFLHDQSSSYLLTTNELFLSVSYSKFFQNNQFTIGLQPGFAFKSFNNEGITFGAQYDAINQIYNSNLSSLEGLSGSARYFDLNLGISWRTLIKEDIMPSAGLSISHLFRPEVSFSSSGSNLPIQLTFTSQVNFPLNSKFDVTPCLLYTSIPGTNEFLLGSTGGMALNNRSVSAKKIYATTLFRINPISNIDALILGGGVKFLKFDLGITYDINVSPLSNVSGLNGAFEVSFIYTGENSNKMNGNQPCYIY